VRVELPAFSDQVRSSGVLAGVIVVSVLVKDDARGTVG